MNLSLENALLGCAAFQGITATVNLGLVRIMRWQPDLDRLPLLLRQVHNVHSWYISITVAMFAVLTVRFAGELAHGTNPALRWLAGGMAIFWTLRVGVQLGYYSPSHWRGHRERTAIHIMALAGFAAMAGCYVRAATM